MDKQIIIDGVDVSGCEFLNDRYCKIAINITGDNARCDVKRNCYYKQLQSAKEEIENFKRKIIIISKNISRDNLTKGKLYYNFFCSLFKLDASPQTKLEILDALIWFIYNDKDLKMQALLFLSESIFDCQYDVLKIRILNLLGLECDLVGNKSKLIRYIYNQIILESPMVRASAISSLGEIGFKEKNLRNIIISLIENCLNDDDNEVRERAFMVSKALKAVEEEKKRR